MDKLNSTVIEASERFKPPPARYSVEFEFDNPSPKFAWAMLKGWILNKPVSMQIFCEIPVIYLKQED